MKRILTLLFLNCIVIAAYAQAPQGFNYQAVARDAAGVALNNQAVGLQISILQGSAAGTAVYTETHAVTSNNLGLINIVVGNGTPTTGTFSSIDWSMGPYFIEISMDASGGTSYTLMGTQQLMSVPYALYAANAGGSPGPTGPAGMNGATGATGANGTNGTAGANGIDGATGTTGAAGTNGTNGTNGATGATGANGATGTAGTNGTNGINGATGTTGTAGTNGTNGTNGATGATGATGTAGTNGTNGATGATGANGATGTAGTNGTNGINGATGTTGTAGTNGTNGTNGATGTTGATGTAGTNGTNGATGATGANGATGTAGTNGTNGINGATGTTGTAGTNGTNGATGATGANGATGTAGTNGTNGATGATGAAGSGGIAEYAYIYNTSAQFVTLGADVMFDSNGPMTSGITHSVGSAFIFINVAGVYKMEFSASGATANQFSIFKNGVLIPGSRYGAASANTQNTGFVIVSCAVGDVIKFNNTGSPGSINLTANTGGSTAAVNASILIMKL